MVERILDSAACSIVLEIYVTAIENGQMHTRSLGGATALLNARATILFFFMLDGSHSLYKMRLSEQE